MQPFACVDSDAQDVVYMPLHGFTAVDLGYQRGNAVSNFINRMDEAVATESFLKLFDQIWRDSSKVSDVTDLICEHIASVSVFVSNENAVYGFRSDAVRSQLAQNRCIRDAAIYQQARVG